VKVLLAGEGRNELGGWIDLPPYRADSPEPGVLQALLEQISVASWVVYDARQWKSIRKYRAGDRSAPETRSVIGLALHAKESGCDVLAFVRDEDGAPQRTADVGAGLKRASELWPALSIVGSTAIPCLEGWLLALKGETGTEQLSKQKAIEISIQAGIGTKDTRALVEYVREHGVTRVAPDAAKLRSWLDAARGALQ
jgi:hypothetical protein